MRKRGILRRKFGFTFENLWIFWGKVLNFSNVTYDVLKSHFLPFKNFWRKSYLTEVLKFFPKTYLKSSYKTVLIKNECRLLIIHLILDRGNIMLNIENKKGNTKMEEVCWNTHDPAVFRDQRPSGSLFRIKKYS